MSNHQKAGREAGIGRKAGRAVVYALLAIWAVIVLFPFYWMILTSLKSYSSYNAEYVPKLYAAHPTLQNYADAFTQVPLGRYFLNSIVFTLATTAIMLAVTINLDINVITMPERIFMTGLNSTTDAQIVRKVKDIKSMLTADR